MTSCGVPRSERTAAHWWMLPPSRRSCPGAGRGWEGHEVRGAARGRHRYIGLVRRSLIRRLATALIAALAGFAAPTAAFAHGIAHQREHHREHHAPNHATTPEHTDATERHGTADAVIGASDDADHPHPQLDCALRVRPDLPSFVLPALVVVRSLSVVEISTEAPVPHDALPRPGPLHGPPPSLRAPPLR